MALRAFGLKPGMVVADGLRVGTTWVAADRVFAARPLLWARVGRVRATRIHPARAWPRAQGARAHEAPGAAAVGDVPLRPDVQMMGLAPRADVVVLSSVLKPTMPVELRRIALCRAAQVLKPGGAVVIFQDCDQENACIAESLEGQFSHLSPFDKGRISHKKRCACCSERRQSITLGCTDARRDFKEASAFRDCMGSNHSATLRDWRPRSGQPAKAGSYRGTGKTSARPGATLDFVSS